MELPVPLRRAVDDLLAGADLAKLKRDAEILSARYRAETRDGRMHLASGDAALAYLAARLPATYAAIRASLGVIADARPDFAPATQIDLGAGPGAAFWAAYDCWPDLRRAVLVEGGDAIRRVGEKLLEPLGAEVDAQWLSVNLASHPLNLTAADLVTISYVLDELEPRDRSGLIARAWALANDTIVIVEPGTPAGWRRILAARDQLVAAGAHLVAPCAHEKACPLQEPDWCHFARRVARSRIHRLTKGADVPWEDEKYIFIAASRTAPANMRARVLASPRRGAGRAELKLCEPDGAARVRFFSKRDGDIFKRARRADWGDGLEIDQAAIR